MSPFFMEKGNVFGFGNGNRMEGGLESERFLDALHDSFALYTSNLVSDANN